MKNQQHQGIKFRFFESFQPGPNYEHRTDLQLILHCTGIATTSRRTPGNGSAAWPFSGRTHRDPRSPWSRNPNMVPEKCARRLDCAVSVSQTHRLSKWYCHVLSTGSSLESRNCLTSGTLGEAIVSYYHQILTLSLQITCAAVFTPTEIWNG